MERFAVLLLSKVSTSLNDSNLNEEVNETSELDNFKSIG